MVAAYIREKWPGPTSSAMMAMADVGDRSVEYDSARAVDSAWFGWQILKAWMFSKLGY